MYASIIILYIHLRITAILTNCMLQTVLLINCSLLKVMPCGVEGIVVDSAFKGLPMFIPA
jgi:hypothetical protein